jgi:DNA-binding NarL/FixJ family response regulator
LAFALDDDVSQPLHTKLSDREYTVMCLIASGKTVSEIAAELCLSSKTISTYRSRILEKMQMKTNAEVMHYAVKHGLVD